MTTHEDILERLNKYQRPFPVCSEAQVYAVQSESDPMEVYYVIKTDHDWCPWLCPCKGFRFTDGCKHITEVMELIEGR